MRKLPIYISLLLLLTCAKEDSQNPNTPPSDITKQYTLTVSAGEGGSVSTPGGTFSSGTQVSITATPSEGYSFSGWSNGSSDNPLSVTINSNTSVTANFQVIVNSYTLTVTAGEGGSVSSEGGEYEEGTEVTITATPDEGYEFIGWSDGETSAERVMSISENQTLIAEFQKKIIYFTYRHPNYSGVNLNSGTVINNIFTPNTVFYSEYIGSEFEIIENCDCYGCGCNTRFVIRNSRFFDFNNDNKPDFFAWMADVSNDDTPGNFSNKGKYLIVEDVFNDPQKYYVESERYFDANSILGDFDSDGYTEILVYSSEDHDNDAGSAVSERIPLSLLKYSGNGNLSITPIGPKTSNHDLVVLDIDNDGDLDIINYQAFMIEEVWDPTEGRPLLYLNDGFGNFSIDDEAITLSDQYWEVFSETPMDFKRDAIDSYDLDNDGNLDIVNGYRTPANSSVFNEGSEVIWGEQGARLSYNNSFKLNTDLFLQNSKSPYGFNFIDYNNDGFIDIIETGQSNAQQYGYIDIHRNNGDRTFTNVTQIVLDKYIWPTRENNQSTGLLPTFYETQVYDIDNDGDFDILIKDLIEGVNFVYDYYHRGIQALGPNTYWENNGGFFIYKEEAYDVDPSWFDKLWGND